MMSDLNDYLDNSQKTLIGKAETTLFKKLKYIISQQIYLANYSSSTS
jgi:hypothetical protein